MTLQAKLTENEIWLQWYRARINLFLANVPMTKEQAFNHLRSLPSFEARTEFINQHVDDQYKIILPAKKRAA